MQLGRDPSKSRPSLLFSLEHLIKRQLALPSVHHVMKATPTVDRQLHSPSVSATAVDSTAKQNALLAQTAFQRVVVSRARCESQDILSQVDACSVVVSCGPQLFIQRFIEVVFPFFDAHVVQKTDLFVIPVHGART